MYYLHILSVAVFVLCTGCKTNHDYLEGHWAIEKMEYNEEDIIIDFISTSLLLDEGNIIRFPGERSVGGFQYGTWKLSKNKPNNILVVDIESEIFSGTYEYSLYKDSNRETLLLELRKDELYILAGKFVLSSELFESVSFPEYNEKK